ncbi:glutamate racemase [Caloramator australicus]|uniref:Glutamate racemase n=1 Tax=Caloramator australicus RC3 TaxID=857293 RepID=I7J4S8_9CLOT|nr:glutamate racemase [Caloramator australicus]CCJ32961.1 Glutamate racemase [Caloramator australicus RC3]
MDTRPIGVFDSGIGGLTVVKEIMEFLPNENIVYFGDTARVPYGTKSAETVTRYAFQNTRFLLTKDVKAIVVACNTASAVSLDALQESFDIPIIGVIKPGAFAAVKATLNKKIGIIGTEGTVNSRAYERVIRKLLPEAEIYAYPCPLFVPIVEEGWANTKVSYMVAEEYLKPLKDSNIDSLVMGCTHYPLLMKVVDDVLEHKVKLINPARETALELKNILTEKGIENSQNVAAQYEYYVSDNPEKFKKVGGNFLEHDIINIKKIDIEKY